MKHILFPTVAAADAFIADLQARGAVKPEVGSSTLNRRTVAAPGAMADNTAVTQARNTDAAANPDMNGSAEDAGAGAVKGTMVGALTGAAAAVIGTVATVATGGIALPVILGMTALGSGVGAAVGGIGGAAGVDETRTAGGWYDSSELDDDAYNRIDSGVNSGGRAVAVDENVPQNMLDEAVRTHGGHFI